ncbi:MAG: hypothetical protein ABEI96_01575 [Haloarculaceae archaeon]
MDEKQALSQDAVAWRHPPPDDGPGEGPAELDASAVEAAGRKSVPKLPDALFEDDDGDGDGVVYWYVHGEIRALVMSNRPIEADGYREVARSRFVEGDDGTRKWEIPAALIVGRANESDPSHVLGDARFEPGEPIHFRATEEMLAGDTRTCFAMTAAQLSRRLE